MVNLVGNVIAGRPKATGGILSGPLGTPAPDDGSPFAALPVSMIPLGYISEDGVAETIGRSTERIKAWGGDSVAVLQTEHSVTYTYTMIEALQEQVNKEVFGEPNVQVTPATGSEGRIVRVQLKSDVLPHRARCIEIADGDKKVRIWLPDSQITETGDVTYADNSLIAYPVTVEAFADANGVKAYKWTSDGVPAVPATGATAGIPGTYSPLGAAAPANIAGLATVTASPLTAWTTGQHVVLGDASKAYWDGASWEVGEAS